MSVADEGTGKKTNKTFSSNDGAAQLDKEAKRFLSRDGR